MTIIIKEVDSLIEWFRFGPPFEQKIFPYDHLISSFIRKRIELISLCLLSRKTSRVGKVSMLLLFLTTWFNDVVSNVARQIHRRSKYRWVGLSTFTSTLQSNTTLLSTRQAEEKTNQQKRGEIEATVVLLKDSSVKVGLFTITTIAELTPISLRCHWNRLLRRLELSFDTRLSYIMSNCKRPHQKLARPRNHFKRATRVLGWMRKQKCWRGQEGLVEENIKFSTKHNALCAVWESSLSLFDRVNKLSRRFGHPLRAQMYCRQHPTLVQPTMSTKKPSYYFSFSRLLGAISTAGLRNSQWGRKTQILEEKKRK